MAWLLLSLRRSELTQSISQNEAKMIKLNRLRNKLSSFSNAVGDGSINPSEIASLGSELFASGLNAMYDSSNYASDVAQQKMDQYEAVYNIITPQTYLENPSIAAQTSIYFDVDGNLDRDAIYSDLYEQSLKEYVQKFVEPWLKEQEEELDRQKNEIETTVQLEKAELDSIKQSISQEIQNSVIQIS